MNRQVSHRRTELGLVRSVDRLSDIDRCEELGKVSGMSKG